MDQLKPGDTIKIGGTVYMIGGNLADVRTSSETHVAISVRIDALDTADPGIQGLNVKKGTGAAATYAIGAIADAVAHISAQRSSLGVVQNRLERTINNLDNIVENTTSAGSQICE